MDPEESDDVRKLLKYPENTAGGIMTTEFAYVDSGLNCKRRSELIERYG